MILRTPVPVIVNEVEKLIRRAGSREPADICEALGIHVRFMNLQQKLKAYYFYYSRISTIVLDDSVSDLFARVLTAHELGHYALHKQIAMLRGFAEMEVLEKRDLEPMETEANLFAAELLLPDAEVLELLKDHTFFETAAMLNVPAALLDFKFSILQSKQIPLFTLGLGVSKFLKEKAEGYDPPEGGC